MKFTYINESPLEKGTDLEFGHQEVATTLKKIIFSGTNNLTIGLFGSWGTGKSSIIETLKTDLTTDRIPLIIFDVWKHEGDALRRTFLKTMINDLIAFQKEDEEILDKNYVLNQRINGTLSTSSEKISIKWQKLGVHALLVLFGVLLVGFTIMMVHIVLFFFYDVNIFSDVSTSKVVTALVGVMTAGTFFKYIDTFIKAEKTEVKEDKFQDPHEFEEEFVRMIGSLKNEKKKIVITFDNLDRVSGENALKIISTIKTFLDYKRINTNSPTVTILIPCDVNSMKHHIEFSIKSSMPNDTDKDFYIDEFLRKFFNTNIWIPDFHNIELESFANKKLKETLIPEFENDSLSWLIIRVFSKNPRQIIQFINLLLSNYILLKEFCETGGFPDREFYKKNVPQLAKFLLIKQKYPEQLKKYQQSSTYSLSDENTLGIIASEEFQILLKETEAVFIGSLEPFFKYRISKSEQLYPGFEKLTQAMTSNDFKEVLTQVEIMGPIKDFEGFDKVLQKAFVSHKNSFIRAIFLNNILVLSKQSLKIGSGLYQEMRNLIKNESEPIMVSIDPMLIYSEILEKDGNISLMEKTRINAKVLTSLSSSTFTSFSSENMAKYKKRIFEYTRINEDILTDSQLNYFRKFLEGDLINPDVFDFFVQDKTVQEKFISLEFKDKYITHLNQQTEVVATLDIIKRANMLEPKTAYITTIIEVIITLKDSVYDLSNQISGDIPQSYNHILVENLEAAIALDNSLIPKIGNLPALAHTISLYLISLPKSEWSEYLSIIKYFAQIDTCYTEADVVISDLLLSNDGVLIEKLIKLFNGIPELLKIFPHVEKNLYRAILASGSEDIFKGLSSEEKQIVISMSIGESKPDYSAQLYLKAYDELTDQQKTELGDKFVESIELSSQYAIPSTELETKIIVFEKLWLRKGGVFEASLFWSIVGSISTMGTTGYSAISLRLIGEYGKNIPNEKVDEIFAQVMNYVEGSGIYDNPVFEEIFLELLSLSPAQKSIDSYIRHILVSLPTVRDPEILGWYTKALSKLHFEPSAFLVMVETALEFIHSNLSVELTDIHLEFTKALKRRIKKKELSENPKIAELIKDIIVK